MKVVNTIMAHCDAGSRREETITSDHWHDGLGTAFGLFRPCGLAAARSKFAPGANLSNGARSIDQTHRTNKKAHQEVGFFVCMARLARFERATAWFVARYSIQLSYRRVEGRYYREEVVLSQGVIGLGSGQNLVVFRPWSNPVSGSIKRL